MLQQLTVVSPRDNDTLTLRRGRALAQVLLLFMIITLGLAAISLIDHDRPAQITTAIGMAIFVLVYAVNRGGRVRLAMLILLIGGTCSTIIGAMMTLRPIPMLFFLGLIVVVAAAFGRPRTPIIWAAVLSAVPFVLNLGVYNTLLAPITPILLPDGSLLPSLFTQELQALALLWMLAGTAYLSGQLLNQLLEESRATAAQALAINQELRRSEERFAKIFQRNPVGISITRLGDGRIIDVNESLLTMMGYRRDDVIGKTTLELKTWDQPDSRKRAVQMLRERQSIGNLEMRFRTKSGELRQGLNAIETIELDGEICLLSMLHDITDRKQLEAQLLQAQKMEIVGRLAGGVAHDFNNLLTAITGYADMAIEALPPANRVRGDIEELRKAAERATGLTRQLLAFARKQRIEPRIVDLNQLIHDMHRFIRRLIGEQIELISLPAPDLGRVQADTSQIEQVIVNLVINARDAMPQGGRLVIETANVELDSDHAAGQIDVAAGRYVLLMTGDTGVGMDATVRQHLFEPFFTTKAPGQGTGLGLATCYGIVKQHGGYILPYSEPGHGTIMKVYLPRVDTPADRQPEAGAPATPRGDETILLVEDEPAVRALAARVLRGQGYTVLEAGDGLEALQVAEQARGARIDLLLTDVIMPRMGGSALAEQLSAARPGIKVLFASGYAEDAVLLGSQLAAGAQFLHKPFSPAALAQKVRGTLDI